MNIVLTDARSITDFTRIGIAYHKVEETEKYMVWEMRRGEKLIGWEVWKPKWRKNPDGTRVWAKVGDEEFGVFGWYCTNEAAVERRKKLLEENE